MGQRKHAAANRRPKSGHIANQPPLHALRVYKEIGYDGMIMPDHVPHIEGDTGGAQAFAFAFGYIQALIQMVGSEA
jgi:D-mannonate dehydratase